MKLTPSLRSLFGPTETVIHECRRCGETLDEEADVCPACHAEAVAEYHI